MHDLARSEQRDLGRERFPGARPAVLRQPEIAGREIEEGRTDSAADLALSRTSGPGQRRDAIRGASLELLLTGDRARPQDARDGAPHDPLGIARVLHLVADRQAK